MTADLLFSVLTGPRGDIGLITLNRPRQLNALTLSMCQQLTHHLQQWQSQANIKAVIIQSASERAFCAGGDIRSIYDAKDHPEVSQAFFRVEYQLNQLIHEFPKPYIALLDGIVMGGGLGISVHGQYRVATANLRLAMPETGIGYFPDVGGSYFLPRCQHFMGWYLGLTGATIDLASAYQAGLVNVVIETSAIQTFINTLQEADWGMDPHLTTRTVLQTFHAAPAPTSDPHFFETCFNQLSLADILDQLAQYPASIAHDTLHILQTRSPTSLKVTYEQLKRGAHLDFAACMQMEYTLCQHFLRQPDFYEGIRAAVVDKDRTPRWQPAELAQITSRYVQKYFLKA
ncbi:MAG: enoyl-CoA hydratase/isomerase family protein [Gammaproteobacteria bacterium]